MYQNVMILTSQMKMKVISFIGEEIKEGNEKRRNLNCTKEL